MLSRKEKRHSSIRQEIIASAEKLLKIEGMEALTIRKLAQLLGYSPAALYEYFTSKEEIILALRQNIYKKQMKRLHNVDVNLSPTDYFHAICIEMLRFRLIPENYRIMFFQLPKESIDKLISEDLIKLRQLLDQTLQKLNLPLLSTPSQRQLAVFILRSYLEGVAHLFFREEMPLELNFPEENTHQMLNLLIKGWS